MQDTQNRSGTPPEQADAADPDVTGGDAPGRVFSQIGPWGLVPVWILDRDLYLPGVPDPAELKEGDEKPLAGAEIRVYIALRSFANQGGHCNPFVQTIADRAKVDRTTTEKAISKFRRLGWLTTKRRHRSDGSIHRCDYYLRDTCPRAQGGEYPPDDGEGVPAKWRVPHPRNGGKGTRDVAGAKNTPDEHTNGTHQGEEWSSTTSGRCAPFGGGTKEERSSDGVKRWTEARAYDRDLFRGHVGDRLRSTGQFFNEGSFDADKVYVALLKYKVKGKPIAWPGKLMDSIYASGLETGVEMFLAGLGLEQA